MCNWGDGMCTLLEKSIENDLLFHYFRIPLFRCTLGAPLTHYPVVIIRYKARASGDDDDDDDDDDDSDGLSEWLNRALAGRTRPRRQLQNAAAQQHVS